jgi:polysaccharide biosynthesis protein PslJ
VIALEHKSTAILTGLALGTVGALLALVIVYAGVVPAFALVLGALVGLYLLTSLDAALIVLLGTAALLPYATLPFRIAITPTLIECGLVGFGTVYLFQWMTGRRREFILTPPSWAILVFVGVVFFAFFLGLRGGRPTFFQINTFVGLLAAISMSLILGDVASDVHTLRRLTLALLVAGALGAFIGVTLWILPDPTAEAILNRLGRIGYPTGGVLRYREDSIQIGNERAIGTWIDPNAYGGFLMMMGGLAGAQLFSTRPLLRWRTLTFGVFGVIGLALFLSDSRGSMLAMVGGLGVVAVLRYRSLIWVGLVVGLLLLLLPQTQEYVGRIAAGFQGQDLETQMRLGEYKDALILIRRYPVFGVGFTGVPTIDLYIGFSSTYFTLAAYTGLVGLGAYLLMMASVIGWGLSGWDTIRKDTMLADIWLGLSAGLIGAMLGGIVDHFYFNPEFQATSIIFWSFMGLFLAATRLAFANRAHSDVGGESDVENGTVILGETNADVALVHRENMARNRHF